MLTASADTIASITGGTVVAGSPEMIANDIAVDSRRCSPGCLFVALPGENTDGHSFVSAALRSGARVLLVTRGAEELELPEGWEGSAAAVRVDDALKAVQNLASWHRRRLHAVVVGITGSTGKTTTKDFLTAVLSTTMRVVATEGNRNNELGLPLTVMRAGADTDVLVAEMGMRGLGQIARLAEIARPDLGLVTNVGTSHIELLGTQDAVAAAKGELVRAVPPAGAVFLNGDDAYSESLALDSRAPVTRYGLGECDICALDITLDDESRPSFTLHTPQGDAQVSLPVSGRHNVYNALAAAAVGLRLAVPLEAIARGLGAAAMSGMRMQVFTTASGITVVNDAYNANPSSMRAGIEALAAMRVAGRHFAVLGDMAELGSLSELAHFQIGEHLAGLGIDVLVTVGDKAARIADGAHAKGLDAAKIVRCSSADQATVEVSGLLEPGDVVLVKASRVMGLEKVVEGIVTPSAG